jgi:hypothetical protein
MTTTISSLPNEISENPQNIKLNVVENNIQDPRNIPSASNGQTQLSQDSINQIVQGIQQASNSNMTSLNSRDIPMDKTDITHDEETKPNHIPPPQHQNYIEEQDSIENMILKNRIKSEEINQLDNIYEEFQTPVIIIILFIFFQMPYFQKGFNENFPQLFHRDGNPTLGGIFVKSILFGILYYVLNKSTIYLSKL